MAERGDTGGLATVLELLGARGEVAGDAGQQGDMFGEPAAALPLAQKGKSGPQGGRPPGARNRSTEEWARFLLSRYQSPLVVLAELYSRPTGELVDELQAMADKHGREVWHAHGGGKQEKVLISPLDVLRLQRDAAVALAPYVHKQQPKALEVDARPRGVVVLGDLDAAEDVSDEIALPLRKVEQNQRGEVGASPQSDEPRNRLEENASADRLLAYREG